MTFPTQPVFVYEGTWSAEMRAHPAMDWMYNFTSNIFDNRAWDIPTEQYLTEDFVLKKSDGTEVHGREAAWAADKALYAPFTAHKHEPRGLMCAENAEGWEMVGRANLYVNLPGAPSEGEKKVKDLDGKEWDAVCAGMFRFLYVKDESGFQGIKLKRTEVCSDPLPALGLMLKRGVVTPEQLLSG
ncbi:uncharacterized protein BDR25DRAFT_313281 [Lindgomyces ingoldianus]|uniref:Uncharacterized protein n=1 Tax=Lindgomyces ingoldianus TaxID=673940 RepID=A0ACB6R0V7_9PLEO|nr:uncharacterized protein BDR25DRAFT_313281 [Lindgomyces ingoldianus]KAF2472086.1 hypothetical protein BDR25DRAFT_313281 [Lindgomyces ingoldianus]